MPILKVIAPGSVCYGAERVPSSGGAVIAFNHLAAIDPPLAGCLSPRPLRCMAKAELLAMPVAGRVIRWTGAFPVTRGAGDREAVRTARRLISEGQLVGLFVEGTRQRLGYPGPVQPGAAMIAMQERVPLLPAGLETFGWRLTHRRPCALVFGHPIDLADLPRNSRGYRTASARIEVELRRLWRQAADALTDGLPLELPDGAHRSTYKSPLAQMRPRARRRRSSR